MGDALILPDDDGKPKLILFVTNRGNTPTVLTHMLVYSYRSWFDRLRGKVESYAMVPSPSGNPAAPGIPADLGINKAWNGIMYYDEDTSAARERGLLYVGVHASHTNKPFLINVPQKTELPGKLISSPPVTPMSK